MGEARGVLTPASALLQAQTRAALLRVLQEDGEHWGSTEDWSSNLAQDVCEVRGREEEGESAGVGHWDLAPSSPPPYTPPTLDHAAAGRAHRASAPHQPGVRGADGPLLPRRAGGVPAEVRRTGDGGGHLDPGSNRERTDESESSQDGQEGAPL